MAARVATNHRAAFREYELTFIIFLTGMIMVGSYDSSGPRKKNVNARQNSGYRR
jgi:hypothetical protein